ncbi:MAG: hypothetical protein HQ485_04830 [Acidobacteria bacterium]|nr:hypothetical protein [Acidobacteriota bacterium]
MRRWWCRLTDPLAPGLPQRHRQAVAGLVVVCVAWLAVAPHASTPAHSIPPRLSDQAFWRLVSETSEPGGYFSSDNLVSNELTFQWVIPRLQERWTDGRAYLGVGPEQNFTYLAALQPSIAFIVDIRPDNLRLQLMYKALIELSPTRAEFLSRLLARPRPADLAGGATPEVMFAAFERTKSSDALFAETLAAVWRHLTEQHGFALTADDKATIEYVLSTFRFAGPGLTYANTGRVGRYPSYQDLMQARDRAGQQRSYLANEALYGRVRSLQLKNLVVPVVGDFSANAVGGAPGALRRVGEYLKAHQAVVGTIYTSNVEQYLFQYGTWPAYYANVATLPIDERSTFVRSCFRTCQSIPGSRSTQLLDPVAALLKDIKAGHIRSYYDVLAHSR